MLDEGDSPSHGGKSASWELQAACCTGGRPMVNGVPLHMF